MAYYRKKFKYHSEGVPAVYRYKGLAFPLHEGSLNMIRQEVELLGRITTKPMYAFFGKQLLTTAQIRERVGLMIEKGLYKPEANTLSAA